VSKSHEIRWIFSAFLLAAVAVTPEWAFAKKSPPLAETIDYIVTNLNSTAFDVIQHRVVNARAIADDPCLIQFEDRHETATYSETKDVRIKLRKIELKSIREIMDISRVSFGGTLYSLNFRSATPFPVTVRRMGAESGATSTELTSEFSLSVNASEERIAARTVAALKHAVTLCGGGSKSLFP
jgi:hypothetical protein